MAKGINKVIIVGNLGRDPETRFMPSGGAVTNVSVATSKSWRDRESGEQKERTEWHRVVFFNRLAEIAGEYGVPSPMSRARSKLRLLAVVRPDDRTDCDDCDADADYGMGARVIYRGDLNPSSSDYVAIYEANK